jgi:chromosome segregation ATPase
LITELEDKLARRDKAFHKLEQQDEHSALATALFESDILRDQIKAIEEEIAALRKESNQVNAESLRVAMYQEVFEVKYYQQQSELRTLRNFRDTAGQELDLLHNLNSQNGGTSVPLQAEICKHLQDTTEQNQALISEVAQMTKRLADYEDYVKVVKDEVHSDLMKAQKSVEYWYSAYYDEAVPKVEKLYKKISALNAELGQEVKTKEQLVCNVHVNDRAYMRYAATETLKDINTKEIPAEYYEPGFVPG